jgi:UDP-glucuronate 4-epimerase
MKLRGLRVLVTGGAGFLGSHTAEALVREGALVAVVDRLEQPSPWKQANLAAVGAAGACEVHSAELEDFAALERAFAAARPDAVIHLGANASVGASIERPLETAAANVTGTLHILELCRRLGVGRLLFASSNLVYGPASPVPFREDALDPTPTSPYAASKLAGEHYCRTWARLFGLRVIVLRISSVYGPRQRLGGAVPNFVAAVESGQPVLIAGDGSTMRDFFHVSDLTAGVAAALAFEHRPSEPVEVFNLGSARPLTLNELVAAVERATGRAARRQYQPAPPDPGGWVDITRAGEWLGWRPRVSLEQGLAGYVEWYRRGGGRENRA